jgi:hypothetical protein
MSLFYPDLTLPIKIYLPSEGTDFSFNLLYSLSLKRIYLLIVNRNLFLKKEYIPSKSEIFHVELLRTLDPYWRG